MNCDSGRLPKVEESWKPISGYEGRYEVSNLGRVRSLPRVQQTSRGSRKVRGGILTPRPDGCGYPSVSLRIGNVHKVVRVHRLVAKAFLPEPAPFQVQVAHLDGSRTNNAAKNLKWACNAENSDHKRFHGTHQAGERHPRAKLTASDVANIRSSPDTNAALGRKYGVNETAIRKIRNGERWKLVGCVASQSGGKAASPKGHRGYIDNPRLYRTISHNPPIARGHRRWIG